MVQIKSESNQMIFSKEALFEIALYPNQTQFYFCCQKITPIIHEKPLQVTVWCAVWSGDVMVLLELLV